MSVVLKLPQFEGPLELLLSLIEERKLDVTRVSLAAVADQYLEFLSHQERISLDNLSAFLVIAARLILLKSKMLLPSLEITEEEEGEIEDLEERLREYKRYKEAAIMLEALLISGRRSYPREKFFGEITVFAPPRGVSPLVLESAFQGLLSDIPAVADLEVRVIEGVMSLEEKIAQLQESLQERAVRSFHHVLSSATNQMDAIVSFLAVLELVKQRVLTVKQEDLFGDIELETIPR